MKEPDRRVILASRVAMAARARRAGRLLEARRLCLEALRERPLDLKALALMRLIKFNQWAGRGALHQLTSLAQGDPASFRYASMLALGLRRQERFEDAVNEARRAVALNPGDAQSHHLLGVCLLEVDNGDDAEGCFEEALRIEPERADFHDALGVARQSVGKHEEATESFERAVALEPTSVTYRTHLVEALMSSPNPEKAIEHARRVVDQVPNMAASHGLLAQALLSVGLDSEAEDEARRAREMDPLDGHTLATLGFILQSRGEMDEAVSMCEGSIALAPRQGAAYLNLVRSRKMTTSDQSLIDVMAELTQDRNLSLPDKCLVEYALGKTYEDLCLYKEAIAHFDEANRMAYLWKFGKATYDRGAVEEKFNRTVELFNAEILASRRGRVDGDALPIFVIGMLRSGTTLTEQILSSHPEIGGAGEQRYWTQRRERFVDDSGSALSESLLGDMAREYCENLRRVSPGKRHVVDKMPTNYQQLGLIHLACPNAKIIHIRRHPVDTCLSVYTTQNSVRLPWAHNKGNIVFNYERYLAFMEHWRSVLPKDLMLEIDYEELVAKPEDTIREVIAFCGVDWSEACLSPERNARNVRTPSVCQVRQPIYKTSMMRWKNFEPWLGELADLPLPGGQPAEPSPVT